MSIFDSLFGNNTSTTTQQQAIAQPAANLATNLFGRAESYANQPWTGYGGPQVAGFTGDQYNAMQSARNISNASSPLYTLLSGSVTGDYAGRPTQAVSDIANRLASTTGTLARTLPEHDIQAYMNPYVEQVLNPAIGDLQRRADQQKNELAARAVRTGSFGGSRNALASQELERNTEQEIGRLSANERARAYTEAVGQIRQDQERIPQLLAAGQQGYKNLSDYQAAGYGNLTNLLSANTARLGTEVNPLLATGGLQQALSQAQIDADKANFLENRDWGSRGLNALMSALGVGGGALGSSTTTTTNAAQPNQVGQILGATTGILGSLGGVSGVANLASSAYNGISSLFGGSGGSSLVNPSWASSASEVGPFAFRRGGLVGI